MPVHDWTRLPAGIFHDFHNSWLAELRGTLNTGLLPQNYYALTEQHTGQYIADILTLHGESQEGEQPPTASPESGGLLLTETPLKMRRHMRASLGRLRRTLAIRHVSGDDLVAVLEVVSPANKDRRSSVAAFVDKTVLLFRHHVNVSVVDLFPPTTYDPAGLHGAIWKRLTRKTYQVPPDEPLSLVTYKAGPEIEAHIEHLAAGGHLIDLPVILREGRYILLPLEATYQAAYRGVPQRYRQLLEAEQPA